MTKHYEHSWPENKDIQTDRPVPYPEVKAYTVAVPNLAGTLPGITKPKELRDTKKLLNYCKKLDGFLGIHPMPPRGTLLIFKTENDAKRGRNLLANDLKVQTGHNICEIWIPEQYTKGGQP